MRASHGPRALKRFAPMVGLVVASALLSGCTNSSGPNSRLPAHNTGDIFFAQQLVASNDQGIAMAQMVKGRGQDADVATLASGTARHFRVEMRRAASLLKSYGSGVPRAGTANPDDIPGMASHDQIKQLRNSTGPAFRHLYLRLMMDKSSGTASLAASETTEGKGRAGLALAREIGIERAVLSGHLRRMGG